MSLLKLAGKNNSAEAIIKTNQEKIKQALVTEIKEITEDKPSIRAILLNNPGDQSNAHCYVSIATQIMNQVIKIGIGETSPEPITFKLFSPEDIRDYAKVGGKIESEFHKNFSNSTIREDLKNTIDQLISSLLWDLHKVDHDNSMLHNLNNKIDIQIQELDNSRRSSSKWYEVRLTTPHNKNSDN